MSEQVPAATCEARVVADVMTTAVVSAHEDALFKEIAAAMRRNSISTVPVLDDQRHVLGVVTAADLLLRLTYERGRPPRGHRVHEVSEVRRKRRGATAGELMTSPAVTVLGETPIRDAATRAGVARVRCLPVVDYLGVLVGMVSKSDLLQYYLRDDEQIRDAVEQHVIVEMMLMDPESIAVHVAEGIVTLTGLAESHAVARELAWQVRSTPGVIGVVNKVRFPQVQHA